MNDHWKHETLLFKIFILSLKPLALIYFTDLFQTPDKCQIFGKTCMHLQEEI